MIPDPYSPSQGMRDLGLGDALQQQVMSQVLEKRKRSLLASNQQPGAFGALALGIGTNGSGDTGGMALQALMGNGAPNGG